MNTIHDKTSRDPVDITAVKVLHSKGVHHGNLNPQPPHLYHSDICPPIFSHGYVWKLLQHKSHNLTGMKFGRMLVVGMVNLRQTEVGKGSSFDGARWAVRCNCGAFEMRRAKAIKNPNNQKDCCRECRTLEQALHFRERWQK